MPWTVPAGHRLGFFYELVATLCLPVTTFVVILLLALLLYGLELRSNRRSRWPLEPHTGCSTAKYPGQSNVRLSARACRHCLPPGPLCCSQTS